MSKYAWPIAYLLSATIALMPLFLAMSNLP